MLSLEEWLAYQTRLHPQAIDLGLERLRIVLDRLAWRQPEIPVITIAGTNGKGSVSSYCAAILAAAGYRVGTFTSPHLRDYRERIQVHDRRVSAAELVSAFERIEAARGAVGLTFFEFNTLAALLVFEASQLDALVLEIGMGGRLDAVNVVDPDVAVVVSIGLDHQEFLGPTLESIAREKAGIFRPGRPAVLGSVDMPVVLEATARALGARLKRPGIEYEYAVDAGGWRFHGSRWQFGRLPAPALLGTAQYANAATAIAALEEVDGTANRRAANRGMTKGRAVNPEAAHRGRLTIPETAVARGLTQVRLAGRFQVIEPPPPSPTWILDVAHNPAAARVLAQNLAQRRGGGRTLAIFGILADKDAAGVAAQLRDCVDAWWCVATEGERGRSSTALIQTLAREVTAPIAAADSIEAACDAVLACAAAADRIVVFGSFHVVGPALDWLEAHAWLPPAAFPEYTAAPRPPNV